MSTQELPAKTEMTKLLDRYTKLRSHRLSFKDAIDSTALRVDPIRQYDVILGRGKRCQDFPGNQRMRHIINGYKQLYHTLPRAQKRLLVEDVYRQIVRLGTRFVTKLSNEDSFVLVDIEVALQKVGNALRCKKRADVKTKAIASFPQLPFVEPSNTSEHSPAQPLPVRVVPIIQSHSPLPPSMELHIPSLNVSHVAQLWSTRANSLQLAQRSIRLNQKLMQHLQTLKLVKPAFEEVISNKAL